MGRVIFMLPLWVALCTAASTASGGELDYPALFAVGVTPPQDWDSAPVEIALPNDLAKGVFDLTVKSKSDRVEYAGCLSYGRTTADRGRLNDEALALASLLAIRRGGDMSQWKSVQDVSDAIASARLSLETSTEQAVAAYEISDVVKGQGMGVHFSPNCVGFSFGNFHTHPNRVASPSETDIVGAMREAHYDQAIVYIVAADEKISMIVSTGAGNIVGSSYSDDDIEKYIALFTALQNVSVERTSDGQFKYLPDGTPDVRDDILAGVLRSYGFVYYAGLKSSLKKVLPPLTADLGSVVYQEGVLHPKRRPFDDAQVLSQELVHSGKTGRDIAFVNSKAAETSTLTDEEYVMRLGIKAEERDFRNLATEFKDQRLDIGSCSTARTDGTVEYYPNCHVSVRGTDFVKEGDGCESVKKADPIVSWHFEPAPGYVTLNWRNPERSGECLQEVHKLLAGGGIGHRIRIESVPR